MVKTENRHTSSPGKRNNPLRIKNVPPGYSQYIRCKLGSINIMFHPPSSEKSRNDNGQCQKPHSRQKAEPDFFDHWLRDVFSLIVHKTKIHHFHSRLNRLLLLAHPQFFVASFTNRLGKPLGEASSAHLFVSGHYDSNPLRAPKSIDRIPLSIK